MIRKSQLRQALSAIRGEITDLANAAAAEHLFKIEVSEEYLRDIVRRNLSLTEYR